VQAFVVGGSPGAAPVEVLIDNGLAGYAVARAAALGEPVASRLRQAWVSLSARHLVTRRAIGGLVAAWAAAGIETLVFKGFALAEFVYAEPSWRAYSDVDVAVRPPADGDWSALTARAAAIASAHGFRIHGRPEFSDDFDSLHGTSYVGPSLLQLVHKQSGTSVDVHCRVIHNGHDESRRVSRQERITDAVWRDSQAVTLEGVPIRIPSAVDSALVGLVLQRTWSTDSSTLRPQDYLDLMTLSASFNRAALEARARELDCSATLRHFLARCDPAKGRVDLRPPNAATRFLYDVLLAHEHGSRTLQLRLHELRYLPKRVVGTTRELPNVLKHRFIWRSGAPPVWPAEKLAAGTTPLDRESWRLTQFTVRRAFQLSGVWRPELQRDLATAAVLYALRKRGVPVERVEPGAGAAGSSHAHGPVLRLGERELCLGALGITREPNKAHQRSKREPRPD